MHNDAVKKDWPWWVRIIPVTDVKNNYSNYMERASALSDYVGQIDESVLNWDCFISSSKFFAVHLTLSFLCWSLTNVIIVRSVNILEKKKKVHWKTTSSRQCQIRKHIQHIFFYVLEVVAGIIFLKPFLPKPWNRIV